jgi:nucleoside-diphosphate-sugar epimerase
MTATIGLLGATGVYARHLIPRLIEAGFAVRALVRRPEAAGVARGCGADIRIADIFDAVSLRAALEGCDISINLATSLPGPSGRGDFETNDRLRRDGTPIWISAAQQAGVSRIVQQSIAMVNACGEQWGDEESAFAGASNELAARAIAAALSMEESVKHASLDWIMLRGGLFYGPGTGFDDDWFARAKAGTLRLPGDGDDFVSLVHIADMATATLAALKHWPSRRAIIVTDDEPVRWRELFAYVAQLANAAAPATGGRLGFPSFRVRSTRARELLGWSPFYRTYRTGLVR